MPNRIDKSIGIGCIELWSEYLLVTPPIPTVADMQGSLESDGQPAHALGQ